MTEHDLYSEAFGKDMDFMDAFHEYPDHSNVRYYHRLKAAIVRDFIRDESGTDASFLDAGGGTGPYCFMANSVPAYSKIHLLEYDDNELQRAIKNLAPNDRIEFKQADLREIPLPSDSIDKAVCSEVLEHIPEESRAISELYRVMKPGGRILFSMPNASSLFYKKVRAEMPKDLLDADMDSLPYPDWERRRHIAFPASDIRNMIRRGGFTITKTAGANVIPLPTSIREKLERAPLAFKAFIFVHRIIARIIPQFGSFYFVEAKK